MKLTFIQSPPLTGKTTLAASHHAIIDTDKVLGMLGVPTSCEYLRALTTEQYSLLLEDVYGKLISFDFTSNLVVLTNLHMAAFMPMRILAEHEYKIYAPDVVDYLNHVASIIHDQNLSISLLHNEMSRLTTIYDYVDRYSTYDESLLIRPKPVGRSLFLADNHEICTLIDNVFGGDYAN